MIMLPTRHDMRAPQGELAKASFVLDPFEQHEDVRCKRFMLSGAWLHGAPGGRVAKHSREHFKIVRPRYAGAKICHEFLSGLPAKILNERSAANCNAMAWRLRSAALQVGDLVHPQATALAFCK